MVPKTTQQTNDTTNLSKLYMAFELSTMAVAKSGKGGNAEGKSTEEMSGEKTSGLSSVMETSLSNQGKNQIVNVCHYS